MVRVRRAGRRQAARPHGLRLRAQRIMMNNWNPDYEGKLATAAHPQAAGAVQGRYPPARQPHHNSGRALLDGAGDHGRCCGSYLTAYRSRRAPWRSRRRFHGSDRGRPMAGRRASRRLKSVWRTRANRATAIPATPVPTPTTWPGAAKPSPAATSTARPLRTPLRQRRRAHPEARARQRSTGAASSITSPRHEDARKRLVPPIAASWTSISSIREVERQLEKAEKDNAQIDPHMESPTACLPISPSISSS